jgi:eukaryotic-like serine/threonine-protein kinase
MGSAEWLGPYRLLEPLGQGGMGVVYRGRHASSERAVAIKTVRVTSQRWMESIRREIDALTRIRHPGIVRIIDHGVHEGRPWYAMDLIEGESLRDFGARIWSPFRGRASPAGLLLQMTTTVPLSLPDRADAPNLGSPGLGPVLDQPPAAAGSLPQVLKIARRICATLAFLHGEGFVSCDLKPDNVLLVGSTPILIDFGLSTRFPAATGREAIDSQRALAGTLPYMSPEQLRGELVDARSDLYAVGCLLYELLTGQPPFVGSTLSIREQHLLVAPAAPSKLVRDLPEALEHLVLSLLAKSPSDRVGFADEVAAELAELAHETGALSEYPPVRPYLYRPSFVGRTHSLQSLITLRDHAASGGGTMVVLGGESGVGKTRLALELMRVSTGAGLQVITSECFMLAPDQVRGAGQSPLYAVRPMLRAVADRCQEGGAELTERLLGPRRSVLALYEPLLAEVPSSTPLLPVVPLDPEASRQRLLRYIAQTLTALSKELPVLWVLDDLGWADDLSLAFLQSLSQQYFSETRALLVGTFRSEEATDSLLAIARAPHVLHLKLAPLDEGEVCQMVAEMLALPSQERGFANYVSQIAEGNPFFVTEHVRTAVTERYFYRDKHYAWKVRTADHDLRASFDALPFPRSLRQLIEHRLRALSPIAHQTARAAAVLGREADTELVLEVAGLSHEAAQIAIDELIRRLILEQHGPSRVRFAHDKLREATYATAGDATRVLHARAAKAIERRTANQSDAAESWATLGYHFAAAGEGWHAARYLKYAGEHAKASFANADAIALFRRAIEQAEQAGLAPQPEPHDLSPLPFELREALGDMLALGGQREQAREEYARALELERESSQAHIAVARLHRKTGKTWEVEHRHDEALRLYRVSRAALTDHLVTGDPGAAREWLQVCLDELWAHYWLAHSDEMETLVREVLPIAEEYGTPQQLAGLHQCRIFYHLRRDRYAIAEDTLALGESVLRISGAEGATDRPWAHFQRGFLLLCSTQLVQAEHDLTSALLFAERAGDIVNQTRAALYLAVVARRQFDIERALARTAVAAKLAHEARMREYIAGAMAMEAWLSARGGDMEGALRSSDQALAIWETYGGVFPFQWLALLPKIEAELWLGHTHNAIHACRGLLLPTQQQLPRAAEQHLLDAIAAWDAAREKAAREALERALDVLQRHAFG